MEDSRIWAFEESLWKADPAQYHRAIDESCLMVVPAHPFILKGMEAADEVSTTPRWTKLSLTDRHVSRPQEGLIVIAYKAEASRPEGETYIAWCTSTYRRLAPEEWRVIQHQQTPPVALGAEPEAHAP